MRKKSYFEHKKIQKLICNIDVEYIQPIVENWINQKYSISKLHRAVESLVDIIHTNGYTDALELYERYKSTNSERERILIRYGSIAVEKYTETLKKRKRGKINTIWSKEYWMNNGLSETDAISRIQKLQSNNAKKRSKASYVKSSKKLKSRLEYWLEIGYTKEEAEMLRRDYFSINTIEGFIERHGEELGEKKYLQCIEKYKKSMKERLPEKKCAGYVSKEGKKFFIILYRRVRKLGITRDEIYFGIDGSREFFLRKEQKKNEGRFVDFCIPKINICVEYNGTFWHARSLETWKNPFVDYEYSLYKDNELKLLCERRNFDLITVWSDEDKNKAIDNIIRRIHDKLEL